VGRKSQDEDSTEEEETKMNVMKDWALELPIRMQSTMMLGLRGPDTLTKNNNAKTLIRELRFAILQPAFPVELERLATDDFMGTQTGYASDEDAEAFLADHDQYPHHWLMHFIHTIEIVGYYHPDLGIRFYWHRLYEFLVAAFHMNPETREQLEQRLYPTKFEIQNHWRRNE
jgi:hypothetical protein